jgi:glucose-6-phosphate isomerase
MLMVNWNNGELEGVEVQRSQKTVQDLRDLFADREAARLTPDGNLVYAVQRWAPVPEGTEGGLFWGTTVVQPGRIGEEYFMTHGHFHAKANRTEYYATVEGRGALILMNAKRITWMEEMAPGTLHHIPAGVGHRVANTGDTPLKFVACWPSDAGYDYEIIRKLGFGARLVAVDGVPTLVRSQA